MICPICLMEHPDGALKCPGCGYLYSQSQPGSTGSKKVGEIEDLVVEIRTEDNKVAGYPVVDSEAASGSSPSNNNRQEADVSVYQPPVPKIPDILLKEHKNKAFPPPQIPGVNTKPSITFVLLTIIFALLIIGGAVLYKFVLK